MFRVGGGGVVQSSALGRGLAVWRPEREWLCAILLAGAAARVALTFLAGAGHIKTDSGYYLTMADAILAGHPISDFPNGLPLLIAALKLLLGPEHLLTGILVLNVVLSTATILLVFLVLERLFTRTEAALAAALVAALPNQLNYVPQVMSEVPCAFALMLATWLLVTGRLAAAGVAYYATAMIRATLLPVGIVLVGGLIVAERWREAFRLAAGLAAGFAIDFALQSAGVVAPPSNLALNLLVSISNTSTAGINFSIDHFSPAERAQPLLTHIRFALTHPVTYLQMKLSALWELWGPWPSNGAPFSYRGPGARLAIGLRFPMLLLALVAFWPNRRRIEVCALVLPAVVLTVIHTAFFANARFSYPAEPLLAMLAVVGAVAVWRGWLKPPDPAPEATS